jgi:hypothetical protein
VSQKLLDIDVRKKYKVDNTVEEITTCRKRREDYVFG